MSDKDIITTEPAAMPAKTGVLAGVLTNPELLERLDVDKLQKLFDLHTQDQERQSLLAFNQAFTAVQAQLRPVHKAARGVHGSAYAKLEAIERMLDPILVEHGFSCSISTEPHDNPKMMTVILTVRHDAGHSERHPMPLPIDTEGRKSPTQQHGATVQYGRRYLKGHVFGVTLAEHDTDGEPTANIEPITEDQALTLETLLHDSGTDPARFCRWAGCTSLQDFPAGRYNEGVTLLQRKIDGAT